MEVDNPSENAPKGDTYADQMSTTDLGNGEFHEVRKVALNFKTEQIIDDESDAAEPPVSEVDRDDRYGLTPCLTYKIAGLPVKDPTKDEAAIKALVDDLFTNELKLSVPAIRFRPRSNLIWVEPTSEDERTKAKELLNNKKWKDYTLNFKDLFEAKYRQLLHLPPKELSECLEKYMPFKNKTYSEQLTEKSGKIKASCDEEVKKAANDDPKLKPLTTNPPVIEDCVPSAIVEGFRNRVTFYVEKPKGFDKPLMGFRIVRTDNYVILPPDLCSDVPKKLSDVGFNFVKFVEENGLTIFNPRSSLGSVHKLNLQMNSEGEIMANVFMVFTSVVKDQHFPNLARQRKWVALLEKWFDQSSAQFSLASVYLTPLVFLHRDSMRHCPSIFIKGKEYIEDIVNRSKHFITVDGDWTCDRSEEGVLAQIEKLANLTKDSKVLIIGADVKCPAISFAQKCRKVFALGLVPQETIKECEDFAKKVGVQNIVFGGCQHKNLKKIITDVVKKDENINVLYWHYFGKRVHEVVANNLNLGEVISVCKPDKLDLHLVRAHPRFLKIKTIVPVDTHPRFNNCTLVGKFEKIFIRAPEPVRRPLASGAKRPLGRPTPLGGGGGGAGRGIRGRYEGRRDDPPMKRGRMSPKWSRAASPPRWGRGYSSRYDNGPPPSQSSRFGIDPDVLQLATSIAANMVQGMNMARTNINMNSGSGGRGRNWDSNQGGGGGGGSSSDWNTNYNNDWNSGNDGYSRRGDTPRGAARPNGNYARPSGDGGGYSRGVGGGRGGGDKPAFARSAARGPDHSSFSMSGNNGYARVGGPRNSASNSTGGGNWDPVVSSDNWTKKEPADVRFDMDEQYRSDDEDNWNNSYNNDYSGGPSGGYQNYQSSFSGANRTNNQNFSGNSGPAPYIPGRF